MSIVPQLCMDISLDDTYVVTGSKGFNGVGCEITVCSTLAAPLLT
jgi:hypothetical protein